MSKQKLNIIRLKKSAQIILPEGIQLNIWIWKDDKGKKHSSVFAKQNNAAVHVAEDSMTLNWGLMSKNGDVRFEKIRIPKQVIAVYFNCKKRQLFQVKRSKKSSPAGKT